MRSNSPAEADIRDWANYLFKTLAVSEPQDGVLLVTLDREQSANTISAQVSKEILELADAIDARSDVRAVVLTGRGRFFCAGADLRDPTLGTPEWVDLGRRAVDRLADLRVPVIAAVNGPAFGGGTEIALACDMRIASGTAEFAVPEIKIGSLPGAGGLTRLQHVVGPSNARRMLFSGCRVNAAEAWRIGLVDQIVAPDRLVESALTFAAEIAEYAPYALSTAKKILTHSLGKPVKEALATEYGAIDLMATPEQLQEQRELAVLRDPAYAKIFKKLEH